MTIDRNSKNYQRKKLAYQLTSSPMWTEFLLPELELRAKRNVQPITTMDMAFTAANEIAKQEQASYLIKLVERLSDEFTNNGDG